MRWMGIYSKAGVRRFPRPPKKLTVPCYRRAKAAILRRASFDGSSHRTITTTDDDNSRCRCAGTTRQQGSTASRGEASRRGQAVHLTASGAVTITTDSTGRQASTGARGVTSSAPASRPNATTRRQLGQGRRQRRGRRKATGKPASGGPPEAGQAAPTHRRAARRDLPGHRARLDLKPSPVASSPDCSPEAHGRCRTSP
jgi:hypothetical protein